MSNVAQSNEVRFSNETVSKLKKLYVINQSLRVVAGKAELRSINESRTIALQTPLGEVLPRDFNIYDLREFISCLSIIPDAIVDFSHPKKVLIKSADATQKLYYVEGDTNMTDSAYFDRDLNLPSVDLEFNITEDQLKSIMTASATLGLEFIGFKTDADGNVLFSAFNKNNGDEQDTNSFSVKIGTSTNTINMFYKADVLRVLEGNPVFQISAKKMSKITCGDMVFWITLDANSSMS